MWENKGVQAAKGRGEKKPGGKTPRDKKTTTKSDTKFQVGDIQLEKLNDSHANKKKICPNSLLHDAGHWLQHEKGRDEIIHN